MTNRTLIESLRGGLIVSCQAPAGSPLHDPYIIARIALTAELNGAAGLRIDSPAHIAATRALVSLPIVGIHKVVRPGSDVYITPLFDDAAGVAAAGADIIAVDATDRPRPDGGDVPSLIRRIADDLRLPVMADIAAFDEGLRAADCGAALVATTLRGYTAGTRGASLPAIELVEKLASKLSIPVICEGGVSSPEHLQMALDAGAHAVVVGGAITGIDLLVRKFAHVVQKKTD